MKIIKDKKLKEKILIALYKYYTADVTFGRAAEDENLPIYYLLKYINDNELPMIETEEDVFDGIEKIKELMKKEGMKGELLA